MRRLTPCSRFLYNKHSLLYSLLLSSSKSEEQGTKQLLRRLVFTCLVLDGGRGDDASSLGPELSSKPENNDLRVQHARNSDARLLISWSFRFARALSQSREPK
eukprot:229331-Rhodomonas_salina.1